MNLELIKSNRLTELETFISLVKVQHLLLTVIRTNSKIGEENFDTILIKTYDLRPNSKGKYEVIVFDPFNEKFEGFEIRISTKEDWEKRKKNDNWLNRASDFSKRIDIEN